MFFYSVFYVVNRHIIVCLLRVSVLIQINIA